ncbi:ABC transporter permease [Desulfurococcaceae archaeon AG1]|jgi:ABC-type uncharacterized transport system permease subunit|nr:MAG: hypothetical protein DJ555_03960 [Desulfurococcaceae archaeon]GAY26102.1 ABC transporter permease [Desulfurococcaceae archaeon AG1]
MKRAKEIFLTITLYIVAILAGFMAASTVAVTYNIGFLDSLGILAFSPFADLFNFSEVLVRFIAIYTIALGVAIALKAGLWNIGGEGQFLVGAVMTLFIAKSLSTPHPALTMTTMILGAGFFAMAWALVPALLKARFGVNEIVTTLLLNIVASSFTLYALDGPIRGQGSFGYLLSDVLPSELRFPTLLKYPRVIETPSGVGLVWEDTRLSYALFITLAMAIILYIVVERSPIETHLGVVARSWRLASYAGINVFRIVVALMLFAGFTAGLSGALHIMGVLYRLDSGQIDHGFGYLAVLAAALGRAKIVGTALASIFISIVIIGSESLQRVSGAPYAITWVFVGTVMIAITIVEYIRGWRPSAATA